MNSTDKIATGTLSLYAVAAAAAKRARTLNEWRNERARALMEETKGPKVTTLALQEIASGEIQVVLPNAERD